MTNGILPTDRSARNRLEERFWSKVNKHGPMHRGLGTECWEWTAHRSPSHCKSIFYGRFGIGQAVHGAHRVSYALAFGELPQGTVVMHKCDNGLCVRPDHLTAGTPADNVADMMRKGRHVMREEQVLRGEKHGNAKLSEQMVREIRARDTAKRGSIRRIAAEYGVHESLVSLVIKRKIWRHVA